MKRAIFLDRDGTINEDIHYLHRIEDFVFLPGVVDALRELQSAGYLLIVVTNQSGVARGYYTEDELQRLNRWMLETLETQGVHITEVYYCPHLPEAAVEAYRRICDCRKPALGLFLRAVREHDIDLSQSYAIGDKLRDCAICSETPCRGFLIGENEDPEVIRRVQSGGVKRVRYAESLYACMRAILHA